MYNRIVDLVINLMVDNLNDMIVTAVAQSSWITYLTCVYLISKLINKGIDTPPLQLPSMNLPSCCSLTKRKYIIPHLSNRKEAERDW